mmetsp:Transcript_29697/g.45896  ORF Transcript_29697/g.45896 Transcript_29697/m.45896 type:complete len:227 (-) Transcript_29697:7-687(-)
MVFEIFAAAEAASEEPFLAPEIRALQLASMDQLLLITYYERYKDLSTWRLVETIDDVDNPCAWHGVSCKDSGGRIKTLYWGEGIDWQVQIPDFDSKWLPTTLNFVQISNFQSQHAFDTRCLPRLVWNVEITSCNLRGTLDLTVLPESLTSLVLSRNRFHGTIRLTRLPPSLRKLILDYNEIEKLVVLNSAIPGVISEYGIRFQTAEKKLQAVCLDEKRVRHGIMYW